MIEQHTTLKDGQRVRLATYNAEIGHPIGHLGKVSRGFADLLCVTFDGDDPDLAWIMIEGQHGEDLWVVNLCEPVEA